MKLLAAILGAVGLAWLVWPRKAQMRTVVFVDESRPSSQPAAALPASPAAPASSKSAPVAPTTPRAPLYPVGLQAKLGSKTATILKAWLDGQGGAHYTVKVDGVPLLGSLTRDTSEDKLRQTLAKEVGQPLAPRQAFPLGLELYRNGQGGLIERVEPRGNTFAYTFRGWPNPVTQAELFMILGRAA